MKYVFAILVGLLVLALLGCNKPKQTGRQLTPAEKVWMKAESELRTNDIHAAYPAMLAARDELSGMLKDGRGGLDYPYCLAILDGRLFLMAKSLGNTNAAETFLKECGYYLNENRKNLRLPPTNISPEAVELMIRRRDVMVHDTKTDAAAQPEGNPTKSR